MTKAAIPVLTAEQLALDAERQDRANCYSAIASLLVRAPESVLLQTMRDMELDEQPDTALGLSWILLQQAAKRTTVEAIDDEYHALFVGVGRGEVVPYGSWHQTGFLMEKPLAALRADLRMLGFERQKGVSETEDHIASLCEVMAAIILAEDISFDAQAAFFKTHLESWVSEFFDILGAARTAEFYKAVAELGGHFFAVEKHYFSMPV